MGSERLRVEYERRKDGEIVLRVSGRLERATAALLHGVLRAIGAEKARVTVDLTDVDHIDAHGLEVLLEAEREARSGRATVEVIGVQESLLERPSPLDEPA